LLYLPPFKWSKIFYTLPFPKTCKTKKKVRKPQWIIDNPKKYLFQHLGPETDIKTLNPKP
jgi:hypothetical protein